MKIKQNLSAFASEAQNYFASLSHIKLRRTADAEYSLVKDGDVVGKATVSSDFAPTAAALLAVLAAISAISAVRHIFK